MAFFKQCLMLKHTTIADGLPATQVHTAWIPEDLAKEGKVLDILKDDGTWDAGWVVEKVHTRMSEEYVREHERDHLTQSEASDKFTPNKGLGIKK